MSETRAHDGRLPVRIAGTATVLPGRPVTTAELAERTEPRRDAREAEARTGIRSRYFAEAGTSAAEMGAQALGRALAAADIPAEALRRVIFVDSLGGDVLFPANANRIAAAIGLAGTCDCFDLGNACMGFLTAFDVGARSVATGQAPVAIVVSERGSRYITPDDPRPFLIFADAAVAVILDRARNGEAMIGSYLRNDGSVDGGVSLAHAGLTGKPETIRFQASNARISELAIALAKRASEEALQQAGMQLADADWVLPHQPNGPLLHAIVSALGVDPRRVVPIVHEVGSVGAASIPLSLDRLLRTRPVRPGDHVLMVGVGAGLSCGAIVVRVSP